MKNYKINIIFYNTSTHFIVLYPNRTQRHLKNPYKAHKYRLCRDLPFYSNSIVPGGLLVISYITRFTWLTSLMILLVTFCSTS